MLAMLNALIYRAATTAPITARRASSQGAFVITALNRRTHVRAFLVASIAYLNLSQPASAAYTESWMSDHDVNAFAQQAKHSPVAASAATAVKPGRQTASSRSNAPAVAHAAGKPVSNAPAVPAKTRKVEHAAGIDPKAPVVAKPKVVRTTHKSATIRH
ncbi:transcriptional regulator [Burkholderia territorii]|uniref:transcriptional regulator n=1 Tax=Burkholderia territorii TaxID=1503055 RepID=UPI000AE58184|nr:transcriptional regulator [Burkholderia territorii]